MNRLKAIVLGIAALAVLSGCNRKVELIDYAILELVGVNERGIAVLSIDEEALAEDLSRIGKLDPEKEEDAAVIADYISRVQITAEPSHQLKNGDTIVLKAQIKNESNDLIRVTGGEERIKVEGLEEGERIDVFDYLTLALSGVSPNLSVAVENHGHDPFFKSLKFKLSESTGLANGDRITVNVIYDPYFAGEQKYYVIADSKEMTIEGGRSYVLNHSNVTTEIRSALQKEADAVLHAFVKEQLWKDASYKLIPKQSVLAIIKSQADILKGQNANHLVFIYRIEGPTTYDAAVYFNDIIKDVSGQIELEGCVGNVGIWDENPNAVTQFVIEDSKEKYDVFVE